MVLVLKLASKRVKAKKSLLIKIIEITRFVMHFFEYYIDIQLSNYSDVSPNILTENRYFQWNQIVFNKQVLFDYNDT